MLRDIEAKNLTAVVGQYEHYSRKVAEGTMNIDGSDAECLIAQEAAPGRRWGVRSAQHVPGNGRLTDLDAELEQFTVDAGAAPERVGNAHLADQFASLASYRPSTRSRAPTPVEPKALAVPLDHSGWLHEHHRLEATRPHGVQANPNRQIDETQPQTARTSTIEDRDLMTKGDESEF
jgi:hypothetical protein